MVLGSMVCTLDCRSFEDIEEAAKPGGICAQGGGHQLTAPQAFSLRHRTDLLEDLTQADVQEMREVVLDILTGAAGEIFCSSKHRYARRFMLEWAAFHGV